MTMASINHFFDKIMTIFWQADIEEYRNCTKGNGSIPGDLLQVTLNDKQFSLELYLSKSASFGSSLDLFAVLFIGLNLFVVSCRLYKILTSNILRNSGLVHMGLYSTENGRGVMLPSKSLSPAASLKVHQTRTDW